MKMIRNRATERRESSGASNQLRSAIRPDDAQTIEAGLPVVKAVIVRRSFRFQGWRPCFKNGAIL